MELNNLIIYDLQFAKLTLNNYHGFKTLKTKSILLQTFEQKKKKKMFNPCHTENFYVLQFCQFFILLTCSIPIISMYLQAEWKTMYILIRWLHKKPADQDLHCFLKRIIQLQQDKG